LEDHGLCANAFRKKMHNDFIIYGINDETSYGGFAWEKTEGIKSDWPHVMGI
jgi:hypothetical protein